MNEDAFYNGMIINQALLDSNYGRYSSAAVGCGWVAVYNALRLLGVEANPQEVCDSMEKLLLLGGINGTPFYALIIFLRQKGFRVSVTTEGASFGRLARKIPTGILFYLYHKKGRAFPMGHFTTFCPMSDGRFHFFNDILGAKEDIRSMSQFRKERPAYFMLLIEICK